MLNAETRAALETVLRIGVTYTYGEGSSEECEEWARASLALQALLDSEKGGGGVQEAASATASTRPTAEQGAVVGARPTASPPPDTPAKIAADLQAWAETEWFYPRPKAILDLIARVEALGLDRKVLIETIELQGEEIKALGLKPNEREVVARIVKGLQAYLSQVNGSDVGNDLVIGPLGAIAALAPIAERK